MKKTIKKLDNNVVKALTQACETAKNWDIGFAWLTHTARYEQFPGSLMVTCVFEQDHAVQHLAVSEQDLKLRRLIQSELLKVGVRVKDIRRHVCFDSEESCARDHDGDWQKRLIHC